jgi:hypothetical protein
MNIPDFFKKNTLIITFTLAGAVGGFLYWKFIGCVTGTCPIKSVWYLSTLWGTAFGYLGGSIILDIIKYFRKRKALAESTQNQDSV